MKRVVLHVDRLVLRGIARADAEAVSAGLRAELRSLLAGPEAVAALGSLGASPVVQAGRARLPRDADAASVGRAVAGRVVRGSKR